MTVKTNKKGLIVVEKIMEKLYEAFEEIEDKISKLQAKRNAERIELGGGKYKYTDWYHMYGVRIEYLENKLKELDDYIDKMQRSV